jgi:PAS domain S-box-containing protein
LESVEQAKEHCRQIVAQGTDRFETKHRTKSGSIRDVEVRAKAVHSGGKVLIQSVWRDITEPKQAQEAVRRSEELYRTLAEAAQDMIFVIGADDSIEYVNSYAAGRFGLKPQQMVGKTRSLLFPPAIAQRQTLNLRRVLETGQTLYLEDSALFKGRRRWLGTSLAPIRDAAGGVRAVLGISRDITDRMDAEEALRKAHDELEAKVKERTMQLRALTAKMIVVEEQERERIGHILHEDLQQTLVAVRYGLHRLRKKKPSDAKEIDVAGVDGIVGKALALTRSLSGDLVAPILHEGDLREALGWLAADMKKKHGIAVELDADADAEPASDALRLFAFRSIRELLFNVAKHAQTKSARVSLKRLAPDRIEIGIRDEGVGFDPARRQANSIGLFRIRERAEHLGGELRIASAPQQGSSVTLILPAG